MRAQELFRKLKSDIRSGTITGRLPSISELTKLYGVSHNTVKKVLDMLKMDGLIYGMQGKGVFVRSFARQKKNKVLVYCRLRSLKNNFYLRTLNMLRHKAVSENFSIDLCTDVLGIDKKACSLCFIVGSCLPEEMTQLQAHFPNGSLFGLNLEFCADHAKVACTCMNDNFAGSSMIMECLYRNGHRNIGVAACSLELEENIFHHRMAGITEFAGKHPDCRITVFKDSDKFTMPSAYPMAEAAAYLREKDPEITAVFAFTDFLALFLLREFQKNGIKVPENISVAGYDNSDFAELISPGLTTVEEDVDGITEAVCKICKDFFAGKKIKDKQIMVRPALIERESVLNIVSCNP